MHNAFEALSVASATSTPRSDTATTRGTFFAVDSRRPRAVSTDVRVEKCGRVARGHFLHGTQFGKLRLERDFTTRRALPRMARPAKRASRTPTKRSNRSAAREIPRATPALTFFTRHDRVYLYVPNIVGYARILLAFQAFRIAFTDVRSCLILYFLSFVCDELDGRFARKFNQTSRFGALLDMLTDRMATSALLVILAMEYREWYVHAIALLALDVCSHWAHAHAQLFVGAESHKDVDARSHGPLLRLYYRNRIFMGACCVSAEVLYLCLHAMRADPKFVGFSFLGPLTFQTLARLATPLWLVKQLANASQLKGACDVLVRCDRLGVD